MLLVADGQLGATFGATGCQHATTISGSHALTETVLVHSLAVVGLKSPFHNAFILIFVLSSFANGVQRYA